MKRYITAFIVLVLLIVTGCSGNSDAVNQSNKQNQAGKDIVTQLDEKELIIGAYSGSFEDIYMDSIIPTFEKKYGVKITYKGNSSAQTLSTVQATRTNPQLDVVVLDDGPFYQGKKEGLWAPLDKAVVTNLPNLYPGSLEPDDVGSVLGSYATGIAYNTEVFKEKGFKPPTSWNDLFRPEFKGKVFMLDVTNSYGLIPLYMFAKINGGGVDNMDPGFAKIKENKQNMVFLTTMAQVEQMIQRKEVWIGVWGSGRAYTLADKGVPVELVVPQEGSPLINPMIAAVKGASHPKLAQLFINYVLSDEVQTILAETQKLGPANKNVKLPKKIEDQVPNAETSKKLFKLDYNKINELRANWAARWDRELAK